MLAIVTGASRGIGSAIARTLAGRGYDIVINYNNSKTSAVSLASEIEKEYGVRATAYKCDVASKDEVEEMISYAHKTFGEIDVLVNNAGIAQQKLFTDITDDDWDRIFATNVRGTFLCTRAVVPHMVRRKYGRIVNISSIWGMVGASCEVHYSASKAAIIGMTKALAQELAPSGITVNCVAPGVIETDMNSILPAETLDILREETPVGRLGTVEDVAHAVAFLADRENSFITGQVISPNGGTVV